MGVLAMQYSTVPTLSSAEQLHKKLEHLKQRYEHISQDLKSKTGSRSLLELKQLEREFLIFDIKKIEHLLSQVKVLKKLHRPTLMEQLRVHPFSDYLRAIRRRYHAPSKPIHLL